MRRFGVLLAYLAALVPCANAQQFTGEFRVNTTTSGTQRFAAIGASATGFVVAWESLDLSTAQREIFLQRFNAAAQQLGGEYRVNTVTTGSQELPSVWMSSSGAFLVVWDGPSGGSNDVFGQRFDAAGAPLDTEFQVSSYTTSAQQHAAAARTSSDEIVVVWDGVGASDNLGVFGRRFSSSGVPLTTDFRVNSATAGNQRYPQISAGQGFVVVWRGSSVDDASGIFARRFDAGGAPLAEDFRVNTTTTGAQDAPAVAMDPDGSSFVVVWVEPTNSTDILGQRFSSTGEPLGGDFRVNTFTTLQQDYPSVVMDADGSFVVLWQSNSEDGSGLGIAGQKFRPDGSPAGVEFRLNTVTSSNQVHPRLATLGQRKRIGVWDSLQDGQDFGIYAQRLGPNGDADGNGVVNVSDVFYLINYLFAGGPVPIGAVDADNNGAVNVTDVFFLINFLFAGGPTPD
jgi:hypothetical protein